MTPLEILFLIIIALLIIGIIAWYIYNRVENYLDINKRMGLYADMATSIKNESIFLNFTNVKQHQDLWDAHETDLKLYAMGTPIEAVFYRTQDVPDGYKIAYATSLSNMEVLSLIGAVKYNKFEVSWDGGQSRIKVNSIKDSVAKKITKKMQDMKKHTLEELKDEVIHSMNKHDTEFYHEGQKLDDERVISHINEAKTTSTSLRFQAIISPNNPLFKAGFAPGEGHERFYYTYNGKCYEFQSVYLGQVENLYQWDFINLEPGTVYAGLAFTATEKMPITPSTTLYGITKVNDDDPKLPQLVDANLGKPTKPDEHEDCFEMWDEEIALKYLGENLLRKTCDVLVKKHHEDKFEEEFVPLNNVAPYYDNFEWLEFGLKYETKEVENSKNK